MPNKVPHYRPATPSVGAYDRLPGRASAKAFYKSPPWRNLRAHKLAVDPLCQDCQAKGFITAATQVHHVLERTKHPDLALELSNLRSLCAQCHGKQRGRTQ